MAQFQISRVLERVANWTGFIFSLWLIVHGIQTRSLWIVVGFFVACAGAFNLGLLEPLVDHLEARQRAKSDDGGL